MSRSAALERVASFFRKGLDGLEFRGSGRHLVHAMVAVAPLVGAMAVSDGARAESLPVTQAQRMAEAGLQRQLPIRFVDLREASQSYARNLAIAEKAQLERGLRIPSAAAPIAGADGKAAECRVTLNPEGDVNAQMASFMGYYHRVEGSIQVDPETRRPATAKLSGMERFISAGQLDEHTADHEVFHCLDAVATGYFTRSRGNAPEQAADAPHIIGYLKYRAENLADGYAALMTTLRSGNPQAATTIAHARDIGVIMNSQGYDMKGSSLGVTVPDGAIYDTGPSVRHMAKLAASLSPAERAGLLANPLDAAKLVEREVKLRSPAAFFEFAGALSKVTQTPWGLQGPEAVQGALKRFEVGSERLGVKPEMPPQNSMVQRYGAPQLVFEDGEFKAPAPADPRGDALTQDMVELMEPDLAAGATILFSEKLKPEIARVTLLEADGQLSTVTLGERGTVVRRNAMGEVAALGERRVAILDAAMSQAVLGISVGPRR